jgi:hypothetical protein
VQEAELAKSLEEQRVVLEKATEDALNVERAKSFEDHQKLSTKVADLSRALERKTNEELGEGAEIDLFHFRLPTDRGRCIYPRPPFRSPEQSPLVVVGDRAFGNVGMVTVENAEDAPSSDIRRSNAPVHHAR